MNKLLTNTFIKYMLSFTTILIIPVLATILISYTFFVKNYKEEVIHNNINSLVRINDSFELKLQQMQNMVEQLGYEPDITAYDLEHYPMSWIQLSDRLSKYLGASVFVNDIFFYVRGSNSIFSTKNKYQLDLFVNNLYDMQGDDRKEFLNCLNTVTKPVFYSPRTIYSSGGYQMSIASCIFPMPVLSAKPYASVLFQIDEGKLKDMLKTDTATEKCNIMILNKHQSVFYSLELAGNEETLFLLNLANKGGHSGWDTLQLNGGKYLVTYYQDSKDWTFFSVTPEKDALRKVRQISDTFLLVILLVIIIGFSAIYVLVYLNYKPLRHLNEFVQKISGTVPEGLNEVETAIRTIQHLSEHGKELNSRVIEQKRNLRDMLLQRLVNGGFRSPEDFVKETQHTGELFIKPFYCIILVRVVSQHFASSFSTSISDMIEKLYDENNIAFCFSMERGRIVILLNSDYKLKNRIEPFLNRLQQALNTVGNEGAQIGVGRFIQDITQLNLSYLEACTTVDHACSQKMEGVVFFSEIMKSREGNFEYPKTEIEQLQRAIQEKNASKFECAMELLCRRLMSGSFLFTRIISYDAVNSIHKEMSRIDTGTEQYESSFDAFHVLNTSNSVEELIQVLSNIKENIAAYLLRLGEEPTVDITMEKIVAYIQRHYLDADFSIQNLAERFQILGNNLSQQFKRHTGQSPLEYVHYLRMEKAKELISSSDEPLRDIVSKVGYSTESAFIKRFRLSVGMTPGEYRKKFGIRT